MNKNLANFLGANGFGFDNSSFSGKLKGFQVSGTCVGNTVNLSFFVNLTESDIQQITDWLNSNKKPYALNNIEVNSLGFNCTVNAVLASAQKSTEVMIAATDYLSTFKKPECCPFCGEEMTEGSRLIGIGSGKFFAHEACFDKFSTDLSAQEALKSAAPKNYLRGTLGAVIGCLVGCVIWILCYVFLDLIAAVGAIVASIFAAFLWDKFGGKNDKIKILVIWVSTLVLVTLAMFASYLIDAERVILEVIEEVGVDGVVTTSPFEALSIFYNEIPEFRQAILVDTVISYIFIVAANIYSTYLIIKSQKLTSKTLRKY